MIRGIGLDVVETARVARALANYGERFAERVYTATELADCAGRADRVEALAARFAAKEACLKALGTGWITGLPLRHVEVVKGTDGSPELRLHGAARERLAERGARRLHVSLSHQPGLAAAVVILED
ncbi:MAG TPA: holo-ACP synthase [Gemmatimonadales bacterium]|nr:holo-ACP synthase [Gemmatimonadales bacterium]